MSERSLLEGAARRHGVITRSEARSHGLSDRQIDHRLARGQWIRILSGVYRLAGAPDTWEGRLLAACVAAGRSAVASHRAASRLWQLPGFQTTPVEIAVPPGRSRRVRGVAVHECCMLLDTDRTMIGGIPVAGIELVLLQLGSVMGGRRIEGIIDHALRQRLTTTERLQERLDLLGRSGRDGAGVLRAALRLRGPGHATTESKLERAFADLVAESRLPTPRLQHEVRNRQGGFIARVDAAWPTAGVAVELDGRSFHEPLDRWNRDLDRQNRLMVEGWTVLRFTWWDVHDRPAQVVRSLRRLLEAAA